MFFLNYFELEQEADRLYGQNDFQTALKLLEQALQKFPGQFLYAAIYIFLLQTKLGDFQAAINTLLALHLRGFACPPYWIEKTPELQKFTRFSEIMAENDRLIALASKSGTMKYQVHLPDGYSPSQKYPLFFVLHGDGLGGDIEYQSWFWKPKVMLQHGMLVVYVQSSQVLYPGCHGWLKDYPTSKKDLKDCFDQLVKQYSIDLQQIYLGGFSGGGIMSTEIAMADDLPVKGWIALCPEIKPPSFTRKNLEMAKERGLKAVFLEGEEKAWLSDQKEMIALFVEVGFQHQLMINLGIGHAFPVDFDQKLDQAISYIKMK